MYEFSINSAYYNELHCINCLYMKKNYLSLRGVKRCTLNMIMGVMTIIHRPLHFSIPCIICF